MPQDGYGFPAVLSAVVKLTRGTGAGDYSLAGDSLYHTIDTGMNISIVVPVGLKAIVRAVASVGIPNAAGGQTRLAVFDGTNNIGESIVIPNTTAGIIHPVSTPDISVLGDNLTHVFSMQGWTNGAGVIIRNSSAATSPSLLVMFVPV